MNCSTIFRGTKVRLETGLMPKVDLTAPDLHRSIDLSLHICIFYLGMWE